MQRKKLLFPQTDNARHDLLTSIGVIEFILFDLAMNVTTITINISYGKNITKFVTKCHKYGESRV